MTRLIVFLKTIQQGWRLSTKDYPICKDLLRLHTLKGLLQLPQQWSRSWVIWTVSWRISRADSASRTEIPAREQTDTPTCAFKRYFTQRHPKAQGTKSAHCSLPWLIETLLWLILTANVQNSIGLSRLPNCKLSSLCRNYFYPNSYASFKNVAKCFTAMILLNFGVNWTHSWNAFISSELRLIFVYCSRMARSESKAITLVSVIVVLLLICCL